MDLWFSRSDCQSVWADATVLTFAGLFNPLPLHLCVAADVRCLMTRSISFMRYCSPTVCYFKVQLIIFFYATVAACMLFIGETRDIDSRLPGSLKGSSPKPPNPPNPRAPISPSTVRLK